ncbi:MAG: HEAT repeat domain-containing protein [Elusimicrobiota bacterium]
MLLWVVVVLAVLLAAGVIGGRVAWSKYSEKRETEFQPLILMAIANEAFRKLGPPFPDQLKPGDWAIMENALFKWSKGLRGFALKAFCQIYEQNGFGEAQRQALASVSSSTRARAAQRLGQMLYLKAVPDLLARLEDRSVEVRRLSSWALANMGHSDAPGHFVTAPKPQERLNLPPDRGASVSGRFYWENGDPIVITEEQESAYLMHKPGGLSGMVKNMARPAPGGRTTDDNISKTYNTEYVLPWVSSRSPTVVKAMLAQPVEGYYAVTYRRRANVPVRDGCMTENIDFVFPRFANADDRVSVVGTLSFPASADRRHMAEVHTTQVTLESEKGEPMFGCLEGGAAKAFRVHDVPPGKYKLVAEAGPFAYAGVLDVTETQPISVKLDLT